MSVPIRIIVAFPKVIIVAIVHVHIGVTVPEVSVVLIIPIIWNYPTFSQSLVTIHVTIPHGMVLIT